MLSTKTAESGCGWPRVKGLVCFPSLTDRNYKVYQRESGLANTHIQAIGEDKAGNIWVSTNKGISCLVDSKDIFYNYDYHDNSPWEASVGAV